MRRTVTIGASVLALFTATLVAQAPTHQVEPLWPKPFPPAKAWIIGSVTGVTVDPQDHVWVVHGGVDSLQANEKGPALEPWASSCCFSAPQVLQFDAAGNLVSSWDPKEAKGYDWPARPSGTCRVSRSRGRSASPTRRAVTGSSWHAVRMPPGSRPRSAVLYRDHHSRRRSWQPVASAQPHLPPPSART